jgi:hypothetical protein
MFVSPPGLFGGVIDGVADPFDNVGSVRGKGFYSHVGISEMAGLSACSKPTTAKARRRSDSSARDYLNGLEDRTSPRAADSRSRLLR